MRTDRLFERYYFSCPEFVDGTTEFHQLLSHQVKMGSSILEIGSGPTNQTTNYLATLGRVTGADVTREIETNIALTEAHTFDGVNLPFPDVGFDACVSNWVVEHLQNPSAHFREVARVLKPGGTYCLRTPNQWHYFTLGSRLIPYGLHLRIANKLRGLPTDSHDPYPTHYRANSIPLIRRLCQCSGLTPLTVFAIEKEPSYGRFHPALFCPMFLYERLVNSFSAFEGLRATILAALSKPEFPKKK